MILFGAQIALIIFVFLFEESKALSSVLVIALLGIYGRKLIEYKMKIMGPILIPSVTSAKVVKYILFAIGVYYIQQVQFPVHDNVLLMSILVIVILTKSRTSNDI